MRIFYASDVHASNRCFKKFLNARRFYECDAIVLGGDITGKAIVPFVEVSTGEVRVAFLGNEQVLTNEEEIRSVEQRVGDTGYYPHRCSSDEAEELSADSTLLHELFIRKIVERVEEWMALADERLGGDGGVPCYINAGNDDPPEIDEVIDAARRVEFLEGRVVELPGGIELASCGFANMTPWHCPRDVQEDELGGRLEGVAAKVHLHESRGTFKLGKTLCINPGSEYSEGVLRGAMVQLNEKKRKLKSTQFLSG